MEDIANSNDRVIVLITLCLNSMIKHGYLPSLFMQSVIKPIVKNKNGDISDSGIYDFKNSRKAITGTNYASCNALC